MVHRIGCAVLERRAQCTCGADRSQSGWGWAVLAGLAGLAVAVWVIW